MTPRKLSPAEEFAVFARYMLARQNCTKALCADYGISRRTLQNIIRRMRQPNGHA